MNIKIHKTIGADRMEIEIDEKDEKEALAKATFFLKDNYCDVCKKQTAIVWESNKAKSKEDKKEYTYIKRRCVACGSTSTAGEYVSGGLFWKKFEKYVPQGGDKVIQMDEPPLQEPQF